MGDYFLGDLVAKFTRIHSKIKIDIRITDVPLDLVAEGIDVAFRGGKLDDSSYIARRIGPTETAIVVSPDYLARHGTPQKLADMAGHEMLIYSLLNRPHYQFLDQQGPGRAFSYHR